DVADVGVDADGLADRRPDGELAASRDALVGELAALVAPGRKPEGAVRVAGLGERAPQLEVLDREPVVGVVLVPLEVARPRSLGDGLVPADPHVGAGDRLDEVDDLLFGDRLPHLFAPPKDGGVEDHVSIRERVAWGVAPPRPLDRSEQRGRFAAIEEAARYAEAALAKLDRVHHGSGH